VEATHVIDFHVSDAWWEANCDRLRAALSMDLIGLDGDGNPRTIIREAFSGEQNPAIGVRVADEHLNVDEEVKDFWLEGATRTAVRPCND